MESKFKVGDQVVWEDKEYASNFDSTTLNSVMVVASVAYDSIEESYLVQMDNGTRAYDFRFKLYNEEPVKQFDMHTQPWFIRVNNEQEFHLVQEWLKENFGTFYNLDEWYPQMMGLTNTNIDGKIYSDYIMWFSDDKSLNQNSNEIKPRFKTIIDSVEWPAVESEKDKKIRELKETIKKAQDQIERLQKLS